MFSKMEYNMQRMPFVAVAICVVLIIVFMGLALSGGTDAITGFATSSCKNVIGGIDCGGELYPFKGDAPCPQDTVVVCTNLCEIDRLMNHDDRICPTYCIEYCMPPAIANKLK